MATELSSTPVLSDKDIKKKMKPKFKEDYQKFYPVKKLEELGFHRGVCIRCGTGYWTQDSSKETCDDTICSGGYRFIGKPMTKKKLDYKQAWDRYVEIFSQWDYKPIERYPVVARWYDDLYFTAAGINAFQPFIVAGTQDPPYQNVLEPQMCLRFNDIDNVGITGTHYTAFIMVGQHVFNSKRLGNSYWMPEGIEQIYIFLKDGLTVPEKEITFHEDIWAGGGNFGPSIEFFAGGIELGNQVYIQYDSATFKQLDTRVIDMGAGLERWSWFTSGKATSYETTFPSVMDFLYKNTGFKPNKDVWNRFMPVAGTLNVDEVDDIRKAWTNVAKALDLDYNQLRKEILPIRALYAIADHTRNLLFAIRDGGLPSNVGGGYNLRNILRRCFSLIDEFQFDFDFHKVFEKHVEDIGSWFTELQEYGSLFNIIDLERERYTETRKKNEKFVQRLVKGKKEIEEKELLKLYDSRGITPESILEINPEINLPENFYLKVQEMHEKRQQRYKNNKLASEVPPTKQLYYEVTYEGKNPFSAKILDIVDNKWLVLDQTHFYPEGGGQVADIGTINDINVTDTQSENQRIFHKVESIKEFSIGQEVTGKIDWDRRYHLMKLHSATHFVNWACKEVLGPHIWQAGARKLPEKATLDITHFKSLTHQEIQQIEKKVNYFINEKPIESIIEIYPRTEAEKKFGMEIYQGGAIPHTHLRIVQWLDDEACSGTHLKSSNEIGFLKILKTERIQDGIVRLEYAIGERALLQVQKQETVIKQLTEQWKVGLEDIPKQAEKITKEWLELNKEITNLKEQSTKLGLEKIFSLKNENPIWLKSSVSDIRLLSSIFANFVKENSEKLIKDPKTVILLSGTGNELMALTTEIETNLKEILQEFCEIIKEPKKDKKKNKQGKSNELAIFQGFKVKLEAVEKITFSLII